MTNLTNPPDNEVRLIGEVQKMLALPSPIDWEAVKKIGEEIQRIAEEAQNDST